MKRKFLASYDYGQGAVWVYLLAESAEEIRQEFPTLSVHDAPPSWMKAEDLAALNASMTIDIADRDHPFLAALSQS